MADLVSIGFLITLLGFFIVFVAAILSSGAAREGGKTKGGGVVMIGPIPLIFGSDEKWTSIAIALAIGLVLLSLLLTFFS